MKKLVVAILAVMIILTGCGAEKDQTNTDTSNNEGREASSEKPLMNTYDVEMNKPFVAIARWNSVDAKANITLSNVKVTQNKSKSDDLNQKYDFVQIDVLVENINDVDLSAEIVKAVSFTFYDENGKEIKGGFNVRYNDELTFESASLRPGGKNEGRLFIEIEKGATPSELIYESHWINDKLGNKYVMKLK